MLYLWRAAKSINTPFHCDISPRPLSSWGVISGGGGQAARIRAHCGGPLISSLEQYSLFVRFYICLSCTDYESLLLS